MTKIVNLYEAKTRLSELVEEAAPLPPEIFAGSHGKDSDEGE